MQRDQQVRNSYCVVLQAVHSDLAAMLTPAGIAVLTEPEVQAEQVSAVVALVTRNAPVDATHLLRYPNLRVVAKHGVGLDAIDLAACKAKNVAVVYTPGANAQAVAEHALALMLALAKRLCLADQAVRTRDLDFKFNQAFHELSGRRLGIAGLGASGRCLARMARNGLNMTVQAFSPSVPDPLFAELGVTRAGTLLELCRNADVLSLHLPARANNRGIVSRTELRALPPGALVVNVGRGGVVDEADLATELASGHLGGVALDVFTTEPPDSTHPLFALDNVILSPHVAGSTQAALRRMAQGVATQILDVLAGRPPASPAP